jgi:sugar-specific transcriptional regulator TrmB
MVVNIIEELGKYGFTRYESALWLALVSSADALSAYEAAKEASIPTSKVYESMARLVEKGLALQIESEGKRKYIAEEPDRVLAELKGRFSHGLDVIGEGLERLKKRTKVAAIFNVDDYPSLARKAESMIEEAEGELLASCWDEEARQLEPWLARAAARGVKCAMVHFGPPHVRGFLIYPHPIEDTLYAERGGRGFSLVRDGAEALTATIYPSGRVEGAYSANKGFATLAEDYIKHDVYITKIVARYGAELERRFGGPSFKKLRNVFKDEEDL